MEAAVRACKFGWRKGGGGKIAQAFPLSSEAAVAKGKANDKRRKSKPTLSWVFPGQY